MNKNLHIWNVDDVTHLRMKLLCSVRGISMAKLLENLIEKEWNSDKTIPDKLQTRKMTRIIKKWK